MHVYALPAQAHGRASIQSGLFGFHSEEPPILLHGLLVNELQGQEAEASAESVGHLGTGF